MTSRRFIASRQFAAGVVATLLMLLALVLPGAAFAQTSTARPKPSLPEPKLTESEMRQQAKRERR